MVKESPATTDFSPKDNSGFGFRHITTSPITSGTPGQSLLSAHTQSLGMWMLKWLLLYIPPVIIMWFTMEWLSRWRLQKHFWVGWVSACWLHSWFNSTGMKMIRHKPVKALKVFANQPYSSSWMTDDSYRININLKTSMGHGKLTRLESLVTLTLNWLLWSTKAVIIHHVKRVCN